MSDFSSEDEDDQHPQNESIRTVEEKFNKAAEHIQHIHRNLNSNDLVDLYGLYKQSTCGNCNIPKPMNLFNPKATSKWSSWNKRRNMDKQEAMLEYVEKVKLLDPEWKIENKNKGKKLYWVTVSTLQHDILGYEDSSSTNPRNDTNEDIFLEESEVFSLVKEGNLEKLKDILSDEDLKKLDQSGLGLIHWATDRNQPEILDYILSRGCDINMKDSDNQTALHYASSCGHRECIEILLKYHPNKSIQDDSGQTCIDVAFDESTKSLLK